MKTFLKIGTLCLIFFCSCNRKELVRHTFSTESAQYEIIYPKEFDNKRDNYIEVKNYESVYDSIKGKNRFPVLYLFVEDTIVDYNSQILSIVENNMIKYAEFSVYDKKIKIPQKLLQDKKGKYKMTVAVLDLIIGDTIKANPSIIGDEDKLDINFIDSRSYHDIMIE